MPESRAPATPPYVNLQDGPFLFETKPIPIDSALQAVVDTFLEYEQYRNSNYDWRWLECDQLYEPVVEVRYWEGSKTRKAAVPNNISFDHVEAATAFIESALFDIPEWFGCEAIQETNPAEARDVQAILEDALSTPYDNYSTAQSEMRLSFKGGVQYGTGMMMMEWDGRRPIFSDLDLRDVYVHHGLKSPRIDDAKSVIIREMVTVDDLKKMKEGSPYMSLPPDTVLYFMTQNQPSAMADAMKQQQELIRGAMATAINNQVPILAQNDIEILRYYDNGHIIWILNRIHVMLNIRNPYGFIPVLSFPCRPRKGRFYGSGFPEAIKYQQLITEGLGNAHLNEISLALDPQITAPLGMKPSDLVTRPGATRTTANPKDVIVHYPPNATKDVDGDITRYEQMAERRNGISSIAQGAARPGNINRTAQGVSTQSEGTNIRLKHVIENIRDYMIVPMLFKMRKMYQVHTTPGQVLLIADSPSGQPRPITAAVFHKPVKMIMDAASRMITRDRLGANLPTVMQYLVNGPVMSGLNAIGLTIDFEEVAQTVQDAAGLPRRYKWVRALTPQEQQQMQQPPPEAMMQQQIKQGDQQLRREVAGMKYQTEMADVQSKIQVAQIQKQPDPMEAQMKQFEMQAKVQFQERQNAQKLQADQQKTQQKMEADRMKIEMKAQSDRQKLEADRAKLQSDVQAKQVETQGKIESHMMGLQMQREQAEENRRQMLMDRQVGISRPQSQGKQNAN
jgi:hypothetical protein